MTTKLNSVAHAMATAKTLEKKGDIVGAVRVYQAIIGRYPSNKRAASALKALSKSKKSALAINAATNPQPAEIHQVEALLKQGKFGKALESARSIQKKYPQAVSGWNLAGYAQVYRGEFDDAEKSLEKALGLQPDNADIINNLAGAYFENNKSEAAYRTYTRSLELNPDAAATYSNRARALVNLKRYEEAIQDAQKSLSIQPNDDRTELTLADAHSRFFQLDEALACFESVLRRRPKSPVALSGMAGALVSLGRIEEGKKAYEKTLGLYPDFIVAHYSLSKLKKYTTNDPQLKQMKRLAKIETIPAKDRAQLNFALFQVHEKLGDTKAAFSYLTLGNDARVEEGAFNYAQEKKINASVRDFFAGNGPEPLHPGPNTVRDRKPIFIVGMPRSGTTLTEQILSSHSLVHGAGELAVLGTTMKQWLQAGQLDMQRGEPQAILKRIRRSYFADPHVGASDVPYVTDKMPGNYLWIGFILAAIPEARIVHLKRDPMAVCWSIYRQLFSASGHKYAYSLKGLGEYYGLYWGTMALWRDLFPGRFYDLDYEQLTQNQEPETRKLLAYCGLDWEDAVLDFHKNKRSVSTASVTQVRQKMYQGSSQDWMRYEKELAPLRAALAPYMSQ